MTRAVSRQNASRKEQIVGDVVIKITVENDAKGKPIKEHGIIFPPSVAARVSLENLLQGSRSGIFLTTDEKGKVIVNDKQESVFVVNPTPSRDWKFADPEPAAKE